MSNPPVSELPHSSEASDDEDEARLLEQQEMLRQLQQLREMQAMQAQKSGNQLKATPRPQHSPPPPPGKDVAPQPKKAEKVVIARGSSLDDEEERRLKEQEEVRLMMENIQKRKEQREQKHHHHHHRSLEKGSKGSLESPKSDPGRPQSARPSVQGSAKLTPTGSFKSNSGSLSTSASGSSSPKAVYSGGKAPKPVGATVLEDVHNGLAKMSDSPSYTPPVSAESTGPNTPSKTSLDKPAGDVVHRLDKTPGSAGSSRSLVHQLKHRPLNSGSQSPEEHDHGMSLPGMNSSPASEGATDGNPRFFSDRYPEAAMPIAPTSSAETVAKPDEIGLSLETVGAEGTKKAAKGGPFASTSRNGHGSPDAADQGKHHTEWSEMSTSARTSAELTERSNLSEAVTPFETSELPPLQTFMKVKSVHDKDIEQGNVPKVVGTLEFANSNQFDSQARQLINAGVI